ncbi:MAG: YdeI/OmpD-associated family protein, partial [Bacilli bacterium]
MDFGKTLYVENREKWHSWLSKNHKTESEIWLIYYYKKTGKPRISYDDAVMEALCFGWIDSILKKIDTERFAQRFSPRKPKSELSQMNKERICELIKEKKMTEWGMKAIAHVFNEKTDKTDNFIIPLDILKKLKANKDAWEYFQKMPPSYQRIRIAYIESRKRQSINMYKKSLDHFIEMTAKNKRIGFV